MSIGAVTSGNYPKYLYTGSASSDTSPSTTQAASAPKSSATAATGSDAVVVSISDRARAAIAALSSGSSSNAALAAVSDNSTAKPAGSLRDRLDAQYAAAKAEGTFISFDSSKGGRWLDLSSFTDDELAQIELNKNGEFSQDELNLAGGALAGRVAHSLESYSPAVQNGDRRAMMMGIKALYSQMSDDVRSALRWTPDMMMSTDNMLDGDSKRLGWLSVDSIVSKLLDASDSGGLHFTRDRLDVLPQMGPDQSSKAF